MEAGFVEIKGLEKHFGKTKAMSDMDLNLSRGRIIGLLGPNGSGKTTLMKLMNGLIKPDRGSIEINGLKPGPGTKAIVSYLPDRMYIADWMRVRDLLKLFSDFYKDFNREKAEDMLRSLGIGEKDRIRTMSKGTREKVQLIGFGTFETKERKARQGRNPRKPEEVIEIAASKAPVFKAGKALKDAVNK